MFARSLTFLALAACSSSASPGADPDKPPSFVNPDGGFSGSTDAGAEECAEETKDVFVISEQNLLYSFHPPTLAFTSKGILKCATGGATPTSMAVDRRGIAWVRHSDGSIWRLDTRDLACTPTSFASPGDTDAFHKFGMGFATASKGGSNEQLYLSDNGGAGLAKLDTKTMKLTFIGPYNGPLEGKTGELTGTGDGKLYGFFVTAPAQVAEISRGTGEILGAKELPNVFAGDAWAFSFYGGDFYIYTSAEGGSGPPLGGGGSNVTRYRPSDGTQAVVKEKIGFKIVGAGVSTCAPTESPK